MGKIIKFPTPHERKMKETAEKLQESEDAVFAASTECAEMSQEFDRLFIKIKKTAEQHKEIREKLEDFEVFFDPDFLPGDDDDDTT